MRNSRSKSKSNDREFSGSFVLLEFRPDERIEFEEWRKSANLDLSNIVPKVTEQNWKISFSYSEHYSCYYGSVTGKGRSDDYEAVTFSVRHADFGKLLAILYYVVTVMLADGRLSRSGNGNPYDW